MTSLPPPASAADDGLLAYWALPSADVLARLRTREAGLTTAEAQQIRQTAGPNTLKPHAAPSAWGLFFRQFQSPISLILIGAAGLSFFLRDVVDASIILVIILVSGVLSFSQEYGASAAMQQLLALVQVKTSVWRDGRAQPLPDEALVPGDVLSLSAGDLVPADCLLLSSNELFLNEATLTGETFPVAKQPGPVPAEAPLAARTNVLLLGASVVSGSGTAVVVRTGRATELGHLAARLETAPPETDFERGIRRFGYLLLELTLVLVLLIFAGNVLLHKPALEAFLFSLAIAVGLTPQLLPAIISINLAQGARRMARQQVVVKRLSSIENLGSMTVLCTDKTGTLTDGTVRVARIIDLHGQPAPVVQRLAKINAQLQQGFRNPLDAAILAFAPDDVAACPRLDEIPYDFIRKRLTILTELDGQPLMVTKGAVPNVLAVCQWADAGGPTPEPLAGYADEIQRRFEELSAQGFRTLGLAIKATGGRRDISAADETGMTFRGFITLFDSPKEGIRHTLDQLEELGIQLKMITGDNALVAAAVAKTVDINGAGEVLTGEALRQLSPEALRHQVARVHVFAEIEPNQKETLIRALQQAGYVVGYLGDGINDASALHAADVGISVDSAVNVAKESADIVLLQHDLKVLVQGVREGRRTFANTMKYLFMATSANFGNMLSMAGASVFLAFLPLLPGQILLTNLLTDLPEMTISSDNVEPAAVRQPARWDLAFIRRFMLTFGLLSSVFDFLSFGLLLWGFGAGPTLFRTGWFVESVLSASVIVLVVRTRRVFYRSRPGKWLLLSTAAVGAAVLLLPLSPLARVLGFAPLPLALYGAILGIVATYALAAEALKQWFYRRYARRAATRGGWKASTYTPITQPTEPSQPASASLG
ncbi:magnesium-translocating P-type ATPase [Hymenobacter convexus]|uniref:magnesium-translocating P-type ATPase n=1 Tax=Hymenobacter sp. CA1UV-4 TaxID=3063782 RepID=UPI00271233B2|nr:magnesium-translocating P-type ATPase [Hymenobacter sp. CA1UV-4]MDO7852468.1 magnesium-translocating P-type ATPase [Hymenobacter sp. CA1UV-4]